MKEDKKSEPPKDKSKIWITTEDCEQSIARVRLAIDSIKEPSNLIPVSIVDALIEKYDKENNNLYEESKIYPSDMMINAMMHKCDGKIQALKEAKKQAIPIEKMIPVSLEEMSISEIRENLTSWLKLTPHEQAIIFKETIPVSVIDARIKELEEIIDIIEPYDHPEFLYEHKERLREWYIKLKELTNDKK